MKNLFKNCLAVKEDDGWLLPVRFTDRQLDLYSRDNATLVRSRAVSSVILAFKSSASKLTLEYRILSKARPWAAFDVLYNGCLMQSVEAPEDSGVIEITLPADPSVEVHIYLPHLNCVELRNITADAPLYPTERKDRMLLALGDSITQGMVAAKPSNAYPSRLSEHFECDLINAGVGGVCFNASALDYIGCEPDIITVALGCNDWGREREEFVLAIDSYIECLASMYKCRKIYWILPIWRNDADGVKGNMTFTEHRALIRETVSKYPYISIVDGYELLPHDEDYYGDPSDIKIHPNDEGLILYAENLINKIEK